MKILFKLLALIGALLLASGAWFVQSCSFDYLKDMRRLERIPRGQVVSVIEGETHLSGKAVQEERNVVSKQTQTPCLYYRYLREREEKDSDGRTTWVTEEDTVDMVPFFLEDESGRILLDPASRASFNLERDFVNQTGNIRISEWRIDPGDSLFVFGYAVKSRDGYRVDFVRPGSYSPLISQFGEAYERSSMALVSLAFSFLALLMLSFSVVLFCLAFSAHRILSYLLLVSLAEGSFLVYLGVALMRGDLADSDARVRALEQRALQEIGAVFHDARAPWPGDLRALGKELERYSAGLPALGAQRVKGIYRNLTLAVMRHNETLTRSPENALRRIFGLSLLEELPVPGGLSAEIRGLGKAKEASAGEVSAVVCMLIGLGIALLCTFFGFRPVKQKRYIENVPTSKSAGLAFGPCEVKGSAVAVEDAMPGPVSAKRCVYYRYLVEERRGSGKNSHWATLEDTKRQIRFECKDDEGAVALDLTGAEIHTTHKHSRREGKMRYSEWNLQPGDELYILGSAVIDPVAGDRLQIGDGDDDDFPFIVANLTEHEMLHKKARAGILWLNGGLNGLMLSAFGLMGLTAAYAATDYLFAALVAPGFLILCLIVLMYNDLQFVKWRVRRSWANIDVSLKKRADLIPNLEAIVKQYLAHEKQLQECITESRRLLEQTGTAEAEGASRVAAGQTRATETFLAVIERYPELKANQLTAELSRDLVRVENEIALMRQGYNDSVERYNTIIGRLPEVLLARPLGFRPAAFFTAELEVRKSIPVPAIAGK